MPVLIHAEGELRSSVTLRHPCDDLRHVRRTRKPEQPRTVLEGSGKRARWHVCVLLEKVAACRARRGRSRVDLGIGPLEVGVGDDPWAAVTGPRDEYRIQVPVSNHPVEVRVDEVDPGRGTRVSEKSGSDVLGSKGLSQQRVVE